MGIGTELQLGPHEKVGTCRTLFWFAIGHATEPGKKLFRAGPVIASGR